MYFNHYIVTRFNCYSPKELIKDNSEDMVSHEWMLHRFKLFSTFTVPSVRNQRGKFTWILRFHPNTDEMWLSLCMDICKGISIIIDKSEEWKKLIGNEVEYVITSRLDNDDILGPNYIEMIQEAFRGRREMVLWENGLNISKQGEYIINQLSNPFLSLIEPRNGMVGCFNKKHLDMIKHESYVVLDGMEWCQVVHSMNVSNKIRKHYIKTQDTWAKHYQEILSTMDV